MRSGGQRITSGLALLLTAATASTAMAASLPNRTDWATGTRWQYETNFLGFPDAWVYVPNGFSRRVPNKRGLVFHLMGCGQMPFQVAQASGWPDAAEAHGLVIVVPGTINPAKPNGDAPNVECLNYGYDGAYGVRNPSRTDRDHAAIIAAPNTLVTDSRYAAWAIDPDQVYVAGLSAGGAVAVQVGCMAPDVFAGVATAAAPGIGTAQGTAVMPPPFGFNKDSVKNLCTQWANSSPDANATQKLSEQVYAIVSDNNGLPAGSGPLDTSKFNNQRIWDGDKFCPHIYGETRAQAFAELLNVTQSQSQVALDTGSGIGCPGGENSRGDSGDVECQISSFVTRNWTALADIYTDANGATRLVRIQQDTLRHSWPSGPIGSLDFDAEPDRDELRADGFLDTTTGEFDRSRMGSARNGQYGTIYFNHQAMDFPMFLAELWTNNNPRLGPPMGSDTAPTVEGLTVTDTDTGAGYELVVEGTARDAQADDVIMALQVRLTDDSGTVVGMTDVPGNGTNVVTFRAVFGGLGTGSYTVTVAVTGADGNVIEATSTVTVGGPANQPPTITLDAATSSGDCLQASGMVSDPDGAVGAVEVVVLGLGPATANVSGGTWSHEVCGLVRGKYNVFAVATDDMGAASPESAQQTVEVGEATGGALEQATGTLTEHIDAGRVTRFTAQWYELRDAHCTQTGLITWECTPYTMYRCTGDTAWTDVMPSCGGTPEPLRTVAIGLAATTDVSTLEVGQDVTFTFTVDNGGPDEATAVHVLNPLPAGLTFVSSPECVGRGTMVRCHLQNLAAGANRAVTVTARATVAGALTSMSSASSAQSANPVDVQATLTVTEPVVPPDAGSTNPAPDAGVSMPAPDAGSGSGNNNGNPRTDAGFFGDTDAGSSNSGGSGSSSCAAVNPVEGFGGLGLLLVGAAARRRRRRA